MSSFSKLFTYVNTLIVGLILYSIKEVRSLKEVSEKTVWKGGIDSGDQYKDSGNQTKRTRTWSIWTFSIPYVCEKRQTEENELKKTLNEYNNVPSY